MLAAAVTESSASSSTDKALVHLVPPWYVGEIWGLLEEGFQKSLRGSKGMTTEAIRYGCENGLCQLWLIEDEQDILIAGTTEIINFGNGWKTLRATYVSGGSAKLVKQILDHVEIWAKSQGCNEMEVYGRKGWARVMGPEYSESARIISKEI